MKHQLKGFELKNQMELATGLKATDAKLRACNATPVLKAPKCKPKSHQAPPAPAQAPKRRTPFTPALPIGYAYPQDALAANPLKQEAYTETEAQIANQKAHSALVNTGHGTLTTKKTRYHQKGEEKRSPPYFWQIRIFWENIGESF